MSKIMTEVYVRLCENGKNFYTVPLELQRDVFDVLKEHNYQIQDDGNVIKVINENV